MEFCLIDNESPYYTQVLDLRNRVLRIPLGLNLFDENLSEDQDQYILIIIRHEKVVACLQLKILDKDSVKLRQMAVDQAMQNTGLGSMLVRYAENFCALNQYSNIELNARLEAVGFYKQLDYQEIGEVFEEVGIPHIKMIKELHVARI